MVREFVELSKSRIMSYITSTAFIERGLIEELNSSTLYNVDVECGRRMSFMDLKTNEVFEAWMYDDEIFKVTI